MRPVAPRYAQQGSSDMLTAQREANRKWWWKGGPGDESEDEIHVFVPLETSTNANDVYCEIGRTHLRIGVRGQQPIIDAELWKEIRAHESGWVVDNEDGKRCVIATLVKRDVWIDYDYLLKEDDVVADTTITHQCFLDVSIDGEYEGRLVVGLYGNHLPLTVNNFLSLCAGVKCNDDAGTDMHYRGCPFHRVVPKVLCQTGDVIEGDGTASVSVYGQPFPDESFAIKHSRAGLLSMANAGPNTNGSQFFFILGESEHLNGKHVVFGELLDGWPVLKRVEACGAADLSGNTVRKVVIDDCGVLLPEGVEDDVADAGLNGLASEGPQGARIGEISPCD